MSRIETDSLGAIEVPDASDAPGIPGVPGTGSSVMVRAHEASSRRAVSR